MSFSWVRAAQLGLIFSLARPISRARASQCATARGPAPGRPMSSMLMPTASIRCRISIFSSMEGSRTEGDCRPSRSDSSFSRHCARRHHRLGVDGVPVVNQFRYVRRHVFWIPRQQRPTRCPPQETFYCGDSHLLSIFFRAGGYECTTLVGFVIPSEVNGFAQRTYSRSRGTCCPMHCQERRRPSAPGRRFHSPAHPPFRLRLQGGLDYGAPPALFVWQSATRRPRAETAGPSRAEARS